MAVQLCVFLFLDVAFLLGCIICSIVQSNLCDDTRVALWFITTYSNFAFAQVLLFVAAHNTHKCICLSSAGTLIAIETPLLITLVAVGTTIYSKVDLQCKP